MIENEAPRIEVTCLDNCGIIEAAHEAMMQGQIIPYFQPKYDYAAKQWCGSEALIRWIHPEIGFLPLDSFIPIYEKTGQITQLDLYMLEAVCDYQQRWKEKQLPVLQIAVNLSQRDFTEQGFADQVMGILERYQTTSEDVRFEITETTCAQCKSSILDFIRYAHEKGYSVDMDDFGSGYASLSMLGEMNVDSIKLDMSLTRKAGIDRRSNMILNAVTQLVKDLGVDVLAEGIETKEQAEYLLGIGCNYMQGYYFSKPLSPIEYQQFLETKDEQHLFEAKEFQSAEDETTLPGGLYQEYKKYKLYSKKRRDRNKTGCAGVSITPEGQYRADITFKGKRFFLGRFASLDEAILERKRAERMDEAFFKDYYEAHPKAKRKTI